MKSIKVIIIRFFLFFYLTSSFLSATHIHAVAEQSSDCNVCLLVKNLHDGDVSTVSSNFIDYEGCYNHLVLKYYYIIPYLFKGFDANAPPIFS